MNEKYVRGPVRVTKRLLEDWPLPEPDGDGKASRGDVWVLGGARETPGAVMLAGLAALRVGAGRLTLAVAESVAAIVAAAVAEAGVVGLVESRDGDVLGDTVDRLAGRLKGCDALLVGPGLGDPVQTAELVRRLPEVVDPTTNVVLDAYALGVLNNLPEEVYEHWAGRLVLTPNVAELQLLLDRSADRLTRPASLIGAVRQAAQRYQAVVTCHNVIAAPNGDSWHCAPNCVGLGTSGSGDVLAGVALGLLGRGATPAQATCWATYLHLSAGHRLTRSVGNLGFLAHELLPELPRVLNGMG
jgi:hydroxyethylthiazole kinase-like uncharacterized protein yjeF